MDGLGIPHPDEMIRGFQQDLLLKIYKKGHQTSTASLPSILLGLLYSGNQPTLDHHIKWKRTGNKLKSWKQLLGLSFHSVADIFLLAAYETDRDTWDCTAINGHSSFSKLFALSEIEGQLLAQKGIYIASHIIEVDDLFGRLTTNENRPLRADLAPFPMLQHKLRVLIQALQRPPTEDKFVGLATKCYALFQLDKKISFVYKKHQRNRLHKSI